MIHPVFDVGEAAGKAGEDGRGDGFGGDVKLGVVGIAVELESMAADDVSKWEHV